MSKITTAAQLVDACIDAAKHKTLYIMGCFGAPMTASNKKRYTSNHSYNKQAARTKKINAASADTFGFDCVCLIKGLLWGWSGDPSRTYGGAGYACNGVPDIGADQMIQVCKEVTTDFSKIEPGEAVWMEGHIGVYIGNGLAVECTPRWDDCVQITAVHNIGTKAGYNGRKWVKHGKLPYVTYTGKDEQEPSDVTGTPSTGSAADEKTIWNFLLGKGLNEFAVAGVMGNLYSESALRSNNLQNSYQTKLGFDDAGYTAAVDNGTYSNFVRDSAGYGLAQWTYWSRKEKLLAFAKAAGKSIGDLGMQLDFLWKELQGYTGVMKVLRSAASIQQASDVILTEFERPADQSAAAKAKRVSYGQKYFDKYAAKTEAPATFTVDELAQQVLDGKWGNGADRKARLTAAGHDYSAVQQRVNEIVAEQKQATIDKMAREVINGKWGNGADRKARLTAAGYDYQAIQDRVNEILG